MVRRSGEMTGKLSSSGLSVNVGPSVPSVAIVRMSQLPSTCRGQTIRSSESGSADCGSTTAGAPHRGGGRGAGGGDRGGGGGGGGAPPPGTRENPPPPPRGAPPPQPAGTPAP